jgi:uncharacterized damage-inducible protein DinB
MIDAHYAVLMAEYNAWMNDKIYVLCAGLTDEQRKADRGAFFKSIHATLNHLLWADRAFLVRLGQLDVPIGTFNEMLFEEFEPMRAERKRFDDRLLHWARTLEDGSLASEYEFVSVAWQRRRRMPRYVMVVQMFNHQTHHRGQLTTLLTQMGLDVGSTDLPFMPFTDRISVDLPL